MVRFSGPFRTQSSPADSQKHVWGWTEKLGCT